MTRVHLLHTNDFHNHLSDTQAARLRQAKAAERDVLLLDAGDAVSAGNVGVRPGGEPILDRMTGAGYDAMTLGNREFHVSEALLRAKIGHAGFPILCANLRRRKEGDTAPLPVQPHLAVTLPSGLRAVAFGLTVPMVTERMVARLISSFVFDDPLAAARAQIKALRPQADILIALSHLGVGEDKRLAAACPELDLVVGGHSHAVLQEPLTVRDVPVVQAGWFGHWFGHIVLDAAPGVRPRLVSSRLISLQE